MHWKYLFFVVQASLWWNLNEVLCEAVEGDSSSKSFFQESKSADLNKHIKSLLLISLYFWAISYLRWQHLSLFFILKVRLVR